MPTEKEIHRKLDPKLCNCLVYEYSTYFHSHVAMPYAKEN